MMKTTPLIKNEKNAHFAHAKDNMDVGVTENN